MDRRRPRPQDTDHDEYREPQSLLAEHRGRKSVPRRVFSLGTAWLWRHPPAPTSRRHFSPDRRNGQQHQSRRKAADGEAPFCDRDYLARGAGQIGVPRSFSERSHGPSAMSTCLGICPGDVTLAPCAAVPVSPPMSARSSVSSPSHRIGLPRTESPVGTRLRGRQSLFPRRHKTSVL